MLISVHTHFLPSTLTMKSYISLTYVRYTDSVLFLSEKGRETRTHARTNTHKTFVKRMFLPQSLSCDVPYFFQMSSSVLSKKRRVSGPDSKVESSWSSTHSVMFGVPPGPNSVSMAFVRMETLSGGGEVPLVFPNV